MGHIGANLLKFATTADKNDPRNTPMKLLITCLIAAFSLTMVDTADAKHKYKKKKYKRDYQSRHYCKTPPKKTGGAPEPSSVIGLFGAAGTLLLRRQR